MQALILAAGSGNRLGKYTKNNTKCMLEINKVRLIDFALDGLHNVGIRKLIIVVGYKKDSLIEYVGKKYKDIDVEYVENPIYDQTNNIYSLYLARDKLKQDDTILLESDLIFEESILKRLLDDERRSLAVVDKYQSWMDGTAVTLDSDDCILSFFTKKIFRYQDVNKYYKTVNIYKFSKEFSENSYVPFLEAYSKAMGGNEYYESVLRVITILEDQELKAMRLNGEKWYEIDDIQDKHNAETIFSNNSTEKLNNIQKRYGGYWRFPALLDFCYLVNPYFPTTKMQEEMKIYFHDLLSQYPSGIGVQNILAGKLFGVEPEDIVVGNGASELIKGLGRALNGTFGLAFPTFNEYPESIGYSRIVQYDSINADFSYSIDDLLCLAKKSDNLLLINPDNPSGHFIKKYDLIKIADKLQSMNKMFIIDESFVDFSTGGEDESLINQEILDKYHNLVVIKSISKSYGVPGVRLGVLATSNKDVMALITQEVSIWNINSFGEFFLQIIGKYKNDYTLGCSNLVRERNRFYGGLKDISYLNVLPSEANYFLCFVEYKYTATELSKLLIDRYDIYIKDLTDKIGFEGKECVRIAVRDAKDNDKLIEVLKNL